MEEKANEATAREPGGARLKKSEKKKRGPVIAGVLLAVMIAADLGLGWYANSRPGFWPNTDILGQDVSGLTAAEAAEKLEAALPDIGLMVYDMPEEGRFYSAGMAADLAGAPPHVVLSLEEMGVSLDPAAAAADAFDFQHGGSILTAGKAYLSHSRGVRWTNFTGKTACQVDGEKLAKAAAQAAEALSYAPQDTGYTVTDDALLLHAAKDGRQVDEAALLEQMKSLSWLGDLSLKAPCASTPARIRTAQEIYDEVHGEVKNAGYDAETDTITPEQMGADFDVSAAQAALDAAAPGETVEIDAKIQHPEVTAADLRAVLFRDVLGEARTKVGGTAARKSNVQLSASTINNYVMNTGDVFSYNGVVGKRTAANGYKPAPAYVKGETVDEIGGGICQTSSTLYLACLRGNLEITERYAHRYIPSYIAAGMDATVSWGGPDYKFTNDTSYPIKIVTSYENGYLTVKLLGTNVTGITAKMTNERLSTTNFEVVYEDDPTLAPGQEKVKTTPYTGSKWRTYRHLYDKDGKLISSAYEATSDYKARNRVILRGPVVQTQEPAAPVIGPGDIPADVPAVPEEPAVPDDPAEEPGTAPVEEPPVSVIVVPEELWDEGA